MIRRSDHIMPGRLQRHLQRHLLTGLLAAVSLLGLVSTPVQAAGRTYVPQNEVVDPRYTHELCRLSKRRIEEGKTKCIYKRQSGGNDTVITIDGTSAACQREYRCKREN